MRLLLIRHGQTPANVGGVLETSRPGPGLTALGTLQAAAIPEALAEERIDAIYVSPLVRTHLTATPLAESRGLPLLEREGLEEIEAGSIEGRTDTPAHEIYMGTVIAWVQGDPAKRMPDGPDGTEFFARYDAAIAGIAAEHPQDAAVAVVSHGAAIRIWAGSRADNTDGDYASHHMLPNTGVVVLEGSPDAGWHVVSWGEQPAGGEGLRDLAADDPTGEAVAD
jgi:broad specificity phosphatase PhoE